jgi:hypothetical protein
MNEHQTETEFLMQCLRYDKSAECQKLQQVITQILRDKRCVERAVSLMVKVTAVSVFALMYPACMMKDFPYGPGQFMVKLICALGGGSLVSLLSFLGLWLVYRIKLNRRRAECRQKVAKLLEVGPAKPTFVEVSGQLDSCKQRKFA